ncbi:MAG: hypothetical protein AAF490_14850 [Chloroflexota bacterium]
MKKIVRPSFVMQRDGRLSNIAYTVIAVLVALAMFVAASGAGSDDFVIEQPLPDWFNIGANVISIIWAILVLIPRTRILGAILVVINMALSMYINYAVGGIEFFAFAVPYNTTTIMLGSILIGHYFEDLPYLFKRVAHDPQKPAMGGIS